MYSVIFQEVIYGSYDPLRAYAGRLNDSLPAPSLELVLRIDASRRELLREGAELKNWRDAGRHSRVRRSMSLLSTDAQRSSRPQVR